MAKAEKPLWEDLAVRAQDAPAAAAPAPAPTAPAPLSATYLTHELRAPVTAIRLGLEILQEGASAKLSSEERQMLELAVRNTNRLEGLVNDIMDFSKIVAGKMTVHR